MKINKHTWQTLPCIVEVTGLVNASFMLLDSLGSALFIGKTASSDIVTGPHLSKLAPFGIQKWFSPLFLMAY